jgi:hypothetical protein
VATPALAATGSWLNIPLSFISKVNVELAQGGAEETIDLGL